MQLAGTLDLANRSMKTKVRMLQMHCTGSLIYQLLFASTPQYLCWLDSHSISTWRWSRFPVPALPLSCITVCKYPYFSMSVSLPIKGAIKLAFAQLYEISRHQSAEKLDASIVYKLLVVSACFLLLPLSYAASHCPQSSHAWEKKKKSSCFFHSVSA